MGSSVVLRFVAALSVCATGCGILAGINQTYSAGGDTLGGSDAESDATYVHNPPKSDANGHVTSKDGSVPRVDGHVVTTTPDGGGPGDTGTTMGPDTGALSTDAGCPAGTHACGTSCLSSTSVLSCGTMCMSCASPDNATPGCDAGACGFACNMGYADCDMNPSNGCEANLSSSASNCGMCGHACGNGTPVCSNGACASGCAVGLTLCGSSCVDTEGSDTSNCGGCGTTCPGISGGIAVCTGGTCGVACDQGSHLCGSSCLPNDSVDSCGSSCSACPIANNAVATCNGTSCGLSCDNGFTSCNGSCVQLGTSQNCSGCGNACSASNTSCQGGACSCSPGYAECGTTSCLADGTPDIPTGTPVVSAMGNTAVSSFDGQASSCLCSLTVYYSACTTYSMTGFVTGSWISAPSSPSGCDFNGITSPGMAQQNFCQECPGENPTLCDMLAP